MPEQLPQFQLDEIVKFKSALDDASINQVKHFLKKHQDSSWISGKNFDSIKQFQNSLWNVLQSAREENYSQQENNLSTVEISALNIIFYTHWLKYIKSNCKECIHQFFSNIDYIVQ